MSKRYAVRYSREEGGWTVEISGNPGGVNCVSWGRSLGQARTRIREALALCLDDDRAAETAEFDEQIEVPAGVEERLAALEEARDRAARLYEETAAETRGIACVLADGGLSVRDAGELLGVSFQRVQQLLEGEKQSRRVSLSYQPDRASSRDDRSYVSRSTRLVTKDSRTGRWVVRKDKNVAAKSGRRATGKPHRNVAKGRRGGKD